MKTATAKQVRRVVEHRRASDLARKQSERQQYHFFGGKGGVGKTTCATAAAFRAADAGRQVLIISTDPAHSLGDALAMRLSSKSTPVPTSHGSLHAIELNADQALDRWLRKRKASLEALAEHGTYLDHDDIEQLLRLSMPGVDEIVGLVELRRLARSGNYDEVIVDTAPTGHTLRLLAMPATLRQIASVFDDMQAKHRFLSESLGGIYRPDAGDDLIEEIDAEGRELTAMLRDPHCCTFAWVLLPEMMSVEEAKDGIGALTQAGIAVSEVIVNRVKLPPDKPCAVCDRRVSSEAASIKLIRASFPGRTILFVPELKREPRGVAEFRHAGRNLQPTARWQKPPGIEPRRHRSRKLVTDDFLAEAGQNAGAADRAERPGKWLDIIAPHGCRLLMFGGKGGVGKTTCAATAALALAEHNPRMKILLLSTDPAHSLGDVFQMRLGDDERPMPGVPTLRVRELDAQQLFHKRRESYLNSINELFDLLQGDSRFDATYDRAVARDLIDLSPPGLDEFFGVLSVSEALLPRNGHRPKYDLAVLDTAPTGHALRLLEMPNKAQQWARTILSILLKYRKVTGLGTLASDLLEVTRELREFIELLHNPDRTRLVVVTRAAQLPRLETVDLLSKLQRLKIEISAVLVNAVTIGTCTSCQRSATVEQREIKALRTKHPKILAPAIAPPPQGIGELRRWGGSWRQVER